MTSKIMLAAFTILAIKGVNAQQNNNSAQEKEITVIGKPSKDTTQPKADTIRVGNFIIVQKNDGSKEVNVSNKSRNIEINFDRNQSARKKKNINTNWWILDLGFANWNDQTNYAAAQAGGYLRSVGNGSTPNASSFDLRNGKSSNVNLWFFMQKVNLSHHVVNLKYGLGLEMYNFRFQRNLSYRSNPTDFAFMDTVSFSKNKLFAGYLTVPFMIHFDPTPKQKGGFNFAAGVSAGYLVGSRNKQISNERGKEKIRGDFDLNPFRIAAIAEVGLGPVRLYGSYSLNNLHKDRTRMEQTPFAIGVRLLSSSF